MKNKGGSTSGINEVDGSVVFRNSSAEIIDEYHTSRELSPTGGIHSCQSVGSTHDEI